MGACARAYAAQRPRGYDNAHTEPPNISTPSDSGHGEEETLVAVGGGGWRSGVVCRLHRQTTSSCRVLHPLESTATVARSSLMGTAKKIAPIWQANRLSDFAIIPVHGWRSIPQRILNWHVDKAMAAASNDLGGLGGSGFCQAFR